MTEEALQNLGQLDVVLKAAMTFTAENKPLENK